MHLTCNHQKNLSPSISHSLRWSPIMISCIWVVFALTIAGIWAIACVVRPVTTVTRHFGDLARRLLFDGCAKKSMCAEAAKTARR